MTSEIRLRILMYLYELHFSDVDDATASTDDIIEKTNLSYSKNVVEREIKNLKDAGLVTGDLTQGGWTSVGITLHGEVLIEEVLNRSIKEYNESSPRQAIPNNNTRFKNLIDKVKISLELFRIVEKYFGILTQSLPPS